MPEYRRCDGYNQKPDSNTAGTGFTNKTSSEVGQFGTGIPRPAQLSLYLLHYGTMSPMKAVKVSKLYFTCSILTNVLLQMIWKLQFQFLDQHKFHSP